MESLQNKEPVKKVYYFIAATTAALSIVGGVFGIVFAFSITTDNPKFQGSLNEFYLPHLTIVSILLLVMGMYIDRKFCRKPK